MDLCSALPSARKEAQSCARELLALAGTVDGHALKAIKHTEAKRLLKGRGARGMKTVGLAASTVFAKQSVLSTSLQSNIWLDHWKPHMLFCNNNYRGPGGSGDREIVEAIGLQIKGSLLNLLL